MLGTIVNGAAIIVGSSIGLIVRTKLPEKLQETVFQGMGLVTVTLGISMALITKNYLIVVLSIVLGAVVGQLLDIDKSIRRATDRLSKNRGGDRATQGFMTSSLMFCVGSMAILGSIEDGLGQTPTLLLTKSVMDGTISIALAATFGIGVMFSAIPVVIYQGLITLTAVAMVNTMSPEMINEMTAVGGILLAGIGITILKIKDINVTNMLPALIFAIIFAYLF